MDSQQLQEHYLPRIKKYWLPLTFSSVGIILMLVGVFSMILSENNSQGVIFEEAASDTAGSNNIVVDVAGAVEKPGVYELSRDARLQEALIAAGGLSQDADREYISKNINLAAKISDGAKIYIPSNNESIKSGEGIKSIKGSGEVAGVVSGLININTASQSELESLPGIGPVTAGKIISGRPYSSVDELLTKKLVGQKVFGEIKDKLSVY